MNKTFYFVGRKTKFLFQQAENITKEEAIKRAKALGLGFIVQFTMQNGNPYPAILAWDVKVMDTWHAIDHLQGNTEALSVINPENGKNQVFIVSPSNEGTFAFPFKGNARFFSRISA